VGPAPIRERLRGDEDVRFSTASTRCSRRADVSLVRRGRRLSALALAPRLLILRCTKRVSRFRRNHSGELISFDEEAAGARARHEQVGDAFESLGPRAQRRLGQEVGSSTITNDGVSIAKDIDLEDRSSALAPNWSKSRQEDDEVAVTDHDGTCSLGDGCEG